MRSWSLVLCQDTACWSVGHTTPLSLVLIQSPSESPAISNSVLRPTCRKTGHLSDESVQAINQSFIYCISALKLEWQRNTHKNPLGNLNFGCSPGERSLLSYVEMRGHMNQLAGIRWKASRNLSVHIILILDATFVPNLKFLGLLSAEISLGEKTVTHPDTHTPRQTPSLFHHPWTCSTPRNILAAQTLLTTCLERQ